MPCMLSMTHFLRVLIKSGERQKQNKMVSKKIKYWGQPDFSTFCSIYPVIKLCALFDTKFLGRQSRYLARWTSTCILLTAITAHSKSEVVRFKFYYFYKSSYLLSLDFYDSNSMTCSSEFSDPTLEPDFVGRSLQHAITWKNISKSRQIVTLTSGKI